jgi:hypothetical protein
MNLYLFMAVFWFVLGLALVVMPWVNPRAFNWTLPGTAVSVGWFAFVLVLYNLMRWALLRSAARRRALEGPDRPPVRRQRPPGPPPEPDPNFNFTDPPPEPK